MSGNSSTGGIDLTPISTLNKGLGAMQDSVEAAGIAELGWNLLRENLSLPSAVLYEDRLLHT